MISGVAVWVAFWVAGLPEYYQQYSFTFLAVGTAALVPPTAWMGWRMISRTKPEYRASRGFWLAVYFTVPFVLLDAAYCGVYLGNGFGFFEKYWYLTVFYVLPWVLFVPMGLLKKPLPAEAGRGSTTSRTPAPDPRRRRTRSPPGSTPSRCRRCRT